MNADIKADWLVRLRQPERVQGYDRLKDAEGRQCCLDILMEMGVEAGIQEPPKLADGRYYEYPNSSGPDEAGLLTRQVIDWSGVSDLDPSVGVPDEYPDYAGSCGLSGLNDSGIFSFTKIADLIEKDKNI
jgi:hypothetical protein